MKRQKKLQGKDRTEFGSSKKRDYTANKPAVMMLVKMNDCSVATVTASFVTLAVVKRIGDALAVFLLLFSL